MRFYLPSTLRTFPCRYTGLFGVRKSVGTLKLLKLS